MSSARKMSTYVEGVYLIAEAVDITNDYHMSVVGHDYNSGSEAYQIIKVDSNGCQYMKFCYNGLVFNEGDAVTGATDYGMLVGGVDDSGNYDPLNMNSSGELLTAASIDDGYVTCGEAVTAGYKGILLAGSDGTNYQCLKTNTSGELETVSNFEYVDGSPFSDGTDIGVMTGGYDGTNYQTFKVDSNGQLYVISSQEDINEEVLTGNNTLTNDGAAVEILSQATGANGSKFGGFIVSGSGYALWDIRWGATGASTTKMVVQTSAATPYFAYNFPQNMQIDLPAGNEIEIFGSNLTPVAAAVKNFTGYANIIYSS